jgi:thymidylate kinase
MDGPQTERFVSEIEHEQHRNQFMTPRLGNRMVQALIKLEHSYYRRIVVPEILVVLRVDPEIAVQRKTNENPLEVRARSQEIWKIDWHQSPAYVIDSTQSKADMLSQLKTFIWSKL